MMRVFFVALISFFLKTAIFSQNSLSIGFSTGTTVGLSQFVPIEGFSPYFTSYTRADFGYDFSIKYFFNASAAIELSISDYIRYAGTRVQSFFDDGTQSRNTSLNADVSILYSLSYNKRVIVTKNDKFGLWLCGGIGLEEVKDRFTSLGGFRDLVLVAYTTKEGWYPRLNAGIATKWNLGKSALGLKLIGGIGFIYHDYYFYEGTSNEVVYNGVSRYKGDYIGLLATYEYVFSLKRDKDKKSKKKRKRKKKK